MKRIAGQTVGVVKEDVFYVHDDIKHEAGSCITKKRRDEFVTLYVKKGAKVTWTGDDWETDGGSTIPEEYAK